MDAPVSRPGHQLQIFKPVVELVVVLVMNATALRHRSILGLPHEDVLHLVAHRVARDLNPAVALGGYVSCHCLIVQSTDKQANPRRGHAGERVEDVAVDLTEDGHRRRPIGGHRHPRRHSLTWTRCPWRR